MYHVHTFDSYNIIFFVVIIEVSFQCIKESGSLIELAKSYSGAEISSSRYRPFKAVKRAHICCALKYDTLFCK